MSESLTSLEREMATLIASFTQIPDEEVVEMCMLMDTPEMQKEAISQMKELKKKRPKAELSEIWQMLGNIILKYQKISHPHYNLRKVDIKYPDNL